MMERHEVSEDGLVWRFTLRPGLRFHDGQPVRAADAVASLNRWARRDPMGQRLMQFTASVDLEDERTFTIRLRERYGLVLETLGKGANPLFVMPERIARAEANTQITETIGSGPFIFVRDEWRPGDRVVYRPTPTTSRARSRRTTFRAGRSRGSAASSGATSPTTTPPSRR